MANILLTTGCNLACEYCFAQERMRGRPKAMSLKDATKVIAFLKRSEYPVFRVMGGEPTLHKRFKEIVGYALQDGFRVDLLSNGTWGQDCNEFFARISPNRLLFLLNIDHPDSYAPKLWSRVERNLSALAGRKSVTMSFNIFEKRPRYQYILDLAKQYGIKSIRMSFSLPVLGARNSYLDVEEYREMGPFVVEFVRQAEAIGVSVQLDNAVPLCAFTFEQLGELVLNGVVDLKRNASCEPVIDIGPDLTVWCCFCLSSLHNRHLDEFPSLQAAQDYYRQVLDSYRGQTVSMQACLDCRYRHLWGCQGGCLTYALIKARDGCTTTFRDHDIQEDEITGSVIALSDDVSISRYDIPRTTYVFGQDASGVNMELDASLRPLWTLLDGRRTAKEVVDQFLDTRSNEGRSTASDRFERDVLRESLHALLAGLLREGFLIKQC